MKPRSAGEFKRWASVERPSLNASLLFMGVTMKGTSLFKRVLVFLSMLTPLATHATSLDQPPRWVLADDVRVRIGPDPEKKVIGTLPRGAELILKSKTNVDDYCLIEGEGHYGYVACQYLSAEPVARRRAGEDGVDVMQRWVSGNGVTVREAPRPDAAVVGRVALNAVVKLVRPEATGGYCEVQLLSGQNGFTACRYLTATPVIIAHVRGYRRADEVPSPDYDPERAFWLEPSWYALEAYAEYLKHLQPGIPPEGPWPRNDVLERMKAHLALGLKGRKPEPYPDWAGLKHKASLNMDLSGESRRLQAQGGKVSDEVWRREWQTQTTAGELQHAIGIWGTLHDSVPIEGAARIIRLVRALEFADIRPSLFRNEAELAPPRVTAEEASGRFGIVYRQVVTPRPKPTSGSENGSGAGLYDMLARTQLLVRPVKRIQLFRDGRLVTESSLLRMKETLWRDVDEPMCSGWIPGFSFGSADARIWRYFGPDAAVSAKSNRNPAGTLYAFYTNNDLPRGVALRTETQVKLDRDATGFVRGTNLYYDLDGDGTPDIAVWEGEGKGPGHLEDSTTTDDRWYRLVLVNVDGAWKVLGSDVFGYGCGC
jgi:uncharacterized protein YgiM (DUF1202 family)